MSARGGRPVDALRCTADATAFQRAFVADLKRRVVDDGEPYVIAQADTPHEIFHAMDIPVVSNQWWAAYLSAKRLSAHYFGVLDDAGFPRNSCRYCTLGFACTLDDDPARAPWGGLPRPAALVARLTCDCIQHVFACWAEALGAPFFPLEAPGWLHKDPAWYAHAEGDWETVFEARRIALMVDEMRRLIEFLEGATERRFDMDVLARLMESINVQERCFAEVAEMTARARPCPVPIREQMTNTMIPQWHRGSDWAISHAGRFRDEVAARIDAGLGVHADERVRLMWIGAGLWHDPQFYRALEERRGAVFVWSMYLPFAAPQYLRALGGRPFEALASRVCSMNDVLHLPPWMNGWMISEARRWDIDAAVMLVPPNNRQSQSGTKITRLALEEAGVPTLALEADMVDPSAWDHGAMVELVTRFLDDILAR